MQYHDWEEEYKSIDICRSNAIHSLPSKGYVSDPTGDNAIRMFELETKMKMIRETSEETDSYLSPWIFRCVTKGETFTKFEAEGCPFGRDMFYDRLRKFFWILDKKRK